MASGKSVELKGFDNMMQWRSQPEWEPKERDRSLRGKARIKARKKFGK